LANLRVDQPWGSAQIMGAVRQIHDKDENVAILDGDGDADGIGFAVGAGVKIGIPGGWEIVGQGDYSEGMEAYVWSGLNGLGDFDGPDGDDTNQIWGGRGGIAGPLISPKLKVWADGAWYHEEEDDPGDVDEADFIAAGVGAAYTPVPGLSFGPEFVWNEWDVDDDRVDGIGETKDYDIWGVMWRVQRNF